MAQHADFTPPKPGVAYYHLPGLFAFYDLYSTFLPLYRPREQAARTAPRCSRPPALSTLYPPIPYDCKLGLFPAATKKQPESVLLPGLRLRVRRPAQ